MTEKQEIDRKVKQSKYKIKVLFLTIYILFIIIVDSNCNT